MNAEVPVNICYRSVGSTFFKNAYSGKRVAVVGRADFTGYDLWLRKPLQGQDKQQDHGSNAFDPIEFRHNSLDLDGFKWAGTYAVESINSIVCGRRQRKG